MTCSSCNLVNGFGKKMKRKHTHKEKKRHSRKKSRPFFNAKDSIKMKKRTKRRSVKKSMKRSFGSFGPGFQGQTSYPTAYAPYFSHGGSVPFLNPSEYYLPQTNGQIQSPQMLYKNAGSNFPGN